MGGNGRCLANNANGFFIVPGGEYTGGKHRREERDCCHCQSHQANGEVKIVVKIQ